MARGNAVRIHDWLVMPAHVYASAISDGLTVKGSTGFIQIGHEREYVDLDTDLIAMKMSPDELSRLGLKTPTISHALDSRGAYVAITGVSKMGTTGVIRPDANVFGRVIYSGTTMPGYSGAAYCSGNHLVGIHTNGGQVNGGYSASYILALLNLQDRVKPEDSENFLVDQFRQGRKIRVDKRYFDLDDVRVEIGGRYAVVGRESMRRAFGNDWYTQLDDLVPAAKSVGFSDPECSGEAKSSKSQSGASSTLEPSTDPLVSEGLNLTRQLAGLSEKKLKALRSLLVSMDSTGPSSVTEVTERRN